VSERRTRSCVGPARFKITQALPIGWALHARGKVREFIQNRLLRQQLVHRGAGWSAPHQTGHSAGVDDWQAMNSRDESMRKPLCGWTALQSSNQAGSCWRTVMASGLGFTRV
jgi:hypothetical protein